MPADRYRSPVPPRLWEQIRDEFGLPTLTQVQDKLTAHVEKPETILQQLVRVFLDEGTYCPGFQFLPDLSLHPVVTSLFNRAMELRIPHNYFALWMMTPSPSLHGRRPVDRLGRDTVALVAAMEETFPGVRPRMSA